MQSILYDRWQATVRAQPRAMALRDLSSGQDWTFSELDQAASAIELPPDGIVHPQGLSPHFLFILLAAWRSGRVVCPLDPGQSPPSLSDTPPDCVHLKLTSASTGVSRLIGFTPDQLAADVENIMITMGLRPDWPNLAVISLAHSYGFSNLVLPLVLRGIPLILCPTALPEAVNQHLRALTAVTLPAVPALWQAWNEAGILQPAIRLAISAGAPLPLPLEHSILRDHALKVHNFYGASECGGIAYDPSDEPRADTACVGIPLHGVAVDTNHLGCLTVQSRAVGQTYWPEPDPALADHRFQSDDLARLADGHVYLCGRAGDVINVAGRKISPETIEHVIRSHPAVRDCLVFGIPADQTGRGERIVAIVACSNPVDTGALRTFLQTQLPPWQIPREWRFVEELQPNQRGKLSRADWRRRYMQLPSPVSDSSGFSQHTSWTLEHPAG
jgi:long-chain acyl-CoA synthetase